MAAAVARAPLPARSSTPPPSLSLNTSPRGTPAPVPNKHLPVCHPGPQPVQQFDTPPASPPIKQAVIDASSLIAPPDNLPLICHDPPVYSIDANSVSRAVEHLATQALPDPKQVFPWLHGLHADNQIQLAFFVQRKKSLRKVPRCIRGLTIVKAGGDLSSAKLKGAIPPSELLLVQNSPDESAQFLEIDPRDGFSVRNFQIQACKMATVSDIIVYSDEKTPREEVVRLAAQISAAQRIWRERHIVTGTDVQDFNTFVVSDPFSTFEENHPELVAVDARGRMTGNVMDFFYWERLEMCTMSEASEISHNVFMGPTPDPELGISSAGDFDVLVETSDQARCPDSRSLQAASKMLEKTKRPTLSLSFPSSGSIVPPTWSHAEVDSLMEMCHWMYRIANPMDAADSGIGEDGDSDMSDKTDQCRKLLIHCADGYTESSLLGLTYFMFAEGLPVHEAWVRLHRDRGRNFFAYASDVALLTSIQPRILQESPRFGGSVLTLREPAWLSKLDGSLPSRILPYMYLGNLNHANNPELLRELGITRVLSVGEPVSWSRETHDEFGTENLLYIDRVQDNGVDPLTEEFGRCLRFIEQSKAAGTATLVHCRVGVSRSATICIAEVMNELGMSFPRAYCFVRARRLNVIIQPHLRFTYELLKWEEYQHQRRGEPLRRELEWGTIAREIALMNRPYSRQ
ncbi:pps1 dual specificty phosphatase [Diplodia corticola]|uniref:Pps1 dual specificty phosphatase n=1 Tax=Diplodia corticola TaxID=236234 RepID=A0A1J9R7A9_9PEZI|nr:pps1 dual specificty phosphatase [Diplodia corticola]OJD36472.1 pps1 dual specificty phosphatase [Diplodia corticola]